MIPSLEPICLASLPSQALGVLADLRCLPQVRVTLAGERAWVRWEPGDERVLARVLPVPGAELYLQQGGRWYRHNRRLPSFGLPVDGDALPLHRVLTPAPVRPEPPQDVPLRPGQVSIVPGDRPRDTAGMMAGLAELAEWADLAPTARLVSIRAARSGGRVLLLGPKLPPLPGGQRFWGERVLVPLGFRPEPALPESALCKALGVADEEILILDARGGEVIPAAVFQPLTRAGVRLAWKELL